MASNAAAADDDPKQPFSAALTRKLILSAVENEKQTKISNEAVRLTAELLRLFVIEARHRASIQAECEQESHDTDDNIARIESHHITKIAAELLMDFS
jgi:hypothetical protein